MMRHGPAPHALLAALLALGAPAALAQTAAPAGEGGEAAAENPIKCTISGYDVVLTNIGAETLPEGTVLDWEVRFARLDGQHILHAPLPPEGMVYMVAALGATYLRDTTPCTGAIAPEPPPG